MGQLKFERKFSEKLNAREIEPKSASWEELSARLSSEKKKENPILWWVGIAATVIGGILIVSLAFIKDPVAEPNSIVDTPLEITPMVEQTGKNQLAAEEMDTEVISDTPAGITKNTSSTEKNLDLVPRKTPESYAGAITPKETETSEIVLAIQGPAEGAHIAGPSLRETLAEVSNPTKETDEVTNAEVDALLAVARSQLPQSAVSEQHIFSEKITANDLLWDVEMEIEASFRDKVFEVVKEGFIKARSAVANRNN